MSLTIERKYVSYNYSRGRPAGTPNTIVIHHWGIDGQNFDNVCRYLCRPNGNTSAHYVVEAGRIAELISPDNRAWHAGAKGNPRGIGIECKPECSAADREQVAQLIAELFKRYGVMSVTKHNDFMNTSCPARWEAHTSWLKRRALEILDEKPTLEVDGILSVKSIARLQELLETPIDGVISGQCVRWKPHLTSLTSTTWNCKGSQAIQALQKKLGVEQDGILGSATITAWQKRLGVTADGYLGAITAKAIQERLNRGEI